MLEVMKWVEVKDLLRGVTEVCAQWRELGNSEELWHCLYEDCFRRPCDSLSPQTSFRENYLQAFNLLIIRNNIATVISVRKLPSLDAYTEITLSRNLLPTDNSAYCLLPGYKALCFGVNSNKEVLLIDLTTGKISETESMNHGRTYPGQLHYNHFIYLFGCSTNTAEKFSISGHHWTLIPDTLKYNHSVSSLTASRHHATVFLVYSKIIETFSLETEFFTGTISADAPLGWCYSLGIVHGDELVVLQNDAVGRWKIDSNETAFRVTKGRSLGLGYYMNSPPVWYQGVFYSVHNDYPSIKGVLSFDPQTLTLEQVRVF